MDPEELSRLALEGRPLDYLNIPRGVINRLQGADIYSIGDLLRWDAQRLVTNVNEFGEKSLDWVVKALAELGLELPPRDFRSLR